MEKVDSIKQKRTRRAYSNRFTLNKESEEKVGSWLKEFLEVYPGTKIKPEDIVNDLFEQLPVRPSPSDIERLNKKHFDEVKHLEWILRAAKTAKKEGRTFSINEHMNASKKRKVQKKNRASKVAEKTDETKGQSASNTTSATEKRVGV